MKICMKKHWCFFLGSFETFRSLSCLPYICFFKTKSRVECPCWNMSQQFQIIIIIIIIIIINQLQSLLCGHLHSSMKGTPNSHRQNFIRLHLSVRTYFFRKTFGVCLRPILRREILETPVIMKGFWGFWT